MSPTPPTQDQDIKPKTQKVTLRIKFPDKDPLILKVKQTTPFLKIYNAVADAQNVDRTSFRLQFDDVRVTPDNKTPQDYDMEDDETLDYFVEQLGGHAPIVHFYIRVDEKLVKI